MTTKPCAVSLSTHTLQRIPTTVKIYEKKTSLEERRLVIRFRKFRSIITICLSKVKGLISLDILDLVSITNVFSFLTIVDYKTFICFRQTNQIMGSFTQETIKSISF